MRNKKYYWSLNLLNYLVLEKWKSEKERERKLAGEKWKRKRKCFIMYSNKKWWRNGIKIKLILKRWLFFTDTVNIK
jgi:hypothetical protein